MIRYIAKKLEFKENQGRIPFDMIIAGVYPTMFGLFKAVVG